MSLSDIPLTYKIGIAGVIFSQIALQLNMTVLPLFMIKDLGGSLAQVGINASVAAAIEVPVMIAWGYIALRLRKDTILAIACAVFAIYFTLMTIADNIIHVFLLQVIAAIAIAAILSINISYLQESIPGRVGLSTSLVDITRVVSALCAAGIFALNSGDTYAPLMAVAAVMSLCGAGFMLLASRV